MVLPEPNPAYQELSLSPADDLRAQPLSDPANWDSSGYGWIYFIAAFASMVIINGIITFMLTSGKWVETHAFWTGFFNPTYWPSLAVRTAIALALAGIYALVTASRLKDVGLKGRMVKWSAAVDSAVYGGTSGADLVVHPVHSFGTLGQR